MEKIRNRIIAISGDPASGKGTVTNKLKEEYEKKGYKVEIFSIGSEFRKLAQEKGLSIEQFNEYISKRKGIDEFIDSRVAKKGQEINKEERPGEIFIFDSRLAFHNIPEAFSIRLTVNEDVAGERVFGDRKRGEEDNYASVEEATIATRNRKNAELARYKKRYGINLHDPKNYDLVVDTSYADIHDIAEIIEQSLECDLKGEPYRKMRIGSKKLVSAKTGKRPGQDDEER